MPKRVYDTLSPLRGVLDEVSVVYRGTKVGDPDVKLLRQALAIRAALLYDISSDWYQSALNAYYRCLCNYRQRSIDAFDLGNDVKAVGLALRLYLEKYENGQRDDRGSFLKSCSCRYPGIVISPVYPLLDDYLAKPSVTALRSLLVFVDFLSKLNFTTISIEDIMIEEYDAQEAAMREWRYDPFIINELNAIVTEWFEGFTPKLAGHCHHGGGSSAGLPRKDRGRLNKDARLAMSDKLFSLFQRWGGDPGEIPPFSKVVRTDDRESELQFVPKSMVTNRVISKEPVALMWLQQGFKEQLYAYFRKQRFLRRVINLEDQSLSAELARRGSRFGSFATLDLSAASDSVSLELVVRLFEDTKLLVPLIETRSTSTRYVRGSKVIARWTLRKFAPMGSALCFPVECIVFAAICECARRRSGSRRLFRVYGDDLVVPTEYADLVCEYLDACHFKVNIRKSYKDSREYNFREACGGEFFNNEDVTPVRLSRALKALTTNPSGTEFSSWTGLYNRLAWAGLRHAASYVLRSIRLSWSYGPVFDCIEFSNSPDRGLISFGPVTERRTPCLAGEYRNGTTVLSEQRFTYRTTHVRASVKAKDKHRVNEQVRALGLEPDEVRYYAWLYDSVYHPRSFSDDLPFELPSYLRPERQRDTEYYPCRDELLVTPLAQ